FTASGIGANTVEFSFTSSDSAHFWYVDLAAVRDQPVVPGMYEGATRYPFQSPTHAGLDISGDGRGCNESTGRFGVLESSFDASGNVLSFAADFEQHCEGDAPALYGAIRFQSTLPIEPRLSIGDAAVIEGSAGAPVTFTISLSQPSSSAVVVSY